MKTLLLVWGSMLLGATLACAGPEQIIKQRAKDVRDQNNARQGVPPPSIPARQVAPRTGVATTSGARAMPAQPALNRLTADLVGIKTNSPVSEAQVRSFARNLAAAAQGAYKPSNESLTRFANSLLPALAINPLTTNSRTRLLQNVMALVNGNGVTPAQLTIVITDVQDILKAAGTPAPTAKTISEDARAVAREVHPTFR